MQADVLRGIAMSDEVVARAGLRALVIHADEQARRETCRALEARGVPAVAAPCGISGLDLLLEQLFQIAVVVADLGTPGLDGWSLVRVIRQLGNEQDLRLVITGEPLEPAQTARLSAMGVDAIVDRAGGADRIAERAVALLEAGPRAAGPRPSLAALPALAGAPQA